MDDYGDNYDEERADNIGRNGNDGLCYPHSIFHDQAEFMRAGGIPFPSDRRQELELAERLVMEEFKEWQCELVYGDINDIKETLDLIYVSVQYLNTLLGPNKALDCWNALHSNNMSKCVDGKLIKREDGKVLKPEDYKPLDLTEVIDDFD